jgi:tetratricopeptide (TPR) repeat protein
MWKISTTLSAIISSVSIYAQTIDEGRQLMMNERYNSAIQTFHKVLKQDPANGEAWLELTKAYFSDGRYEEIVDTLKLANEEVRQNPYYKVALGKTLLQSGHTQEALALFNQAAETNKKKNAGTMAAIAEAHVNAIQGNADEALAIISKLLKKDKKNINLHLLKGDAYRKLSDGTEAFKSYQEVIEQNKNYAPAYYRLGQIFLTQKNREVYTDYFKKALEADSGYAPALYSMYVYELYRNPSNAMSYFQKYVRHSDASVQHDYDFADLLFLNKKYDAAIKKVDDLIEQYGADVQPRLYKLKGYSYAELKDSSEALKQMQLYLSRAADSNIIAKDYVSISEFYSSQPGQDSLAAAYLKKAIPLEKDSLLIYSYYKNIADIARDRQDFAEQANWMEKYYTGNEKASNIDLFYWGLAHYRAENFAAADSVFGFYVTKYPEQSFGYYWQAKSKALQDKDMEKGLAIPTYHKLVEVLQKDTADVNFKKWMVEAYGYLAAYEANNQKDYTEAIDYFEKVLEVDPANETAIKYIEVLEKRESATE